MPDELYDIYEIASYKTANNDFIENNVKQYTLEKLLQKLQADKGYHIRVDPEKYYTFFGDIDGHKQKSNDFFEFMINFLKDFYDIIEIEISDISYTRNESKEGSYHYSIPKLYCNCKKMKEIIGNMKIEYDKIYGKEQNKVIDTSIYSKHWFRMPNQTKEGVEGTEHFIVRGELVDFVVECIDDVAINIGNKKYKNINAGKEIVVKDDVDKIEHDKLKKTDFLESEIIKFVSLLSMKRCNNYQDWLNVGICLKNINNDYLHIWTEWSKKGDDYEDGCCTKKWKTFGKVDDGKKLGIGSLIKWVQDDNPKKFKELWSEHNVNRIIKLQKKLFPDNKLEIAKIIQNNEQTYVKLKDEFCPINNKSHNDTSSRSIEIYKPGNLTMKCSHKNCEGKIFPCNHIKLNSKDAKTVFNTLVVNNNYYGEDENLDFDVVKIIDDNELNKLMFDLLNITSDENYAKIAYYLNPKKFIYDVDTWYEFKNHRWIKKKGDNISFKRDVLKQIKTMLMQILEHYKDDKKASSYIKKQIKNIGDDVASKKIMNKITEEFSYSCSDIDSNPEEGEFYKKLDKNPYLLGFTNGVYDLKKFEFRDGKPEDFVSMTVGYPYANKYSKQIKDIEKFFKQIQPDKEQREFVLTYLSSCLLGIQKDEIYIIFTGATRNGKTTCMELLNLTLGDEYFGTIPTTFLTRPCSDAGKATPEIVALEKKRVVVTSENEANDKLNTGHVKKITGGDKMDGRQLYSGEMVNFKPQFKLISLFNQIPDVDKLDAGFWSRCKVVDFPMTFVENPTEENELALDKNLKQKLEEWKQDFMLLLIEHCKQYVKNGLKFPKSVEKQTNIYKSSVDCYENYFSENIIVEQKNILRWEDLKADFSYWYKENIDDRIPNAKTIKFNFEKKFKKNVMNCKRKEDDKLVSVYGWNGFKIKSDE